MLTTASDAYNDFIKWTQAEHKANPNVEITLSGSSFSRGGGTHTAFLNEVWNKGVPAADATPITQKVIVTQGEISVEQTVVVGYSSYIIAPKTANLGVQVFYDRVVEGGRVEATTHLPDAPPDKLRAIEFIADNENRKQFAGDPLSNPANPDPRVERHYVPGDHSDIGKGHWETGIGLYTLDAGYKWLAASGLPLAERNPALLPGTLPLEIHDSFKGFWGSAGGPGIGDWVADRRAAAHYHDSAVPEGTTQSKVGVLPVALEASDWQAETNGNTQLQAQNLARQIVPVMGYMAQPSAAITAALQALGPDAKAYLDSSGKINLVSANGVAMIDAQGNASVRAGDVQQTFQRGHSQLLGNDSDDGGAANLRVSWVGNAVGGSVAAQADGSALFTPSANYFGQARFQYQLTDADNASTLATAYVNVTPVNDAPVIITLTNAGTWGTIQAYDPDSDMSRLVYELSSAPSHGYAAVQGHQRADGVQEATWTYASNAADPYYGPVSFAVRVRDPEGASVTGTLWVNHTGGFAPVALDMDGDGVELVAAAASTTFADVDADGTEERLGWVSPDDAVLAYDADDNGQIDIATETTFVQYLPGAQTDLEGLTAFDTDGDGLLSAQDAEWARFGALQDANASGQQDAGEFQTLDALGVQSISLTRQGTPTVVEGNTVFGTADVTHTDGRVTQAADVMFAVQEVEAKVEVEVQAEVEVDETAYFNNLAQSFNQLCAAVAAEPVAGEAVTAAAPLAELSLVPPPDTSAVIAPLIEAANAGTMALAASG